MLIRFIDKKHVDDFLDGNLYMSSLSKFWSLRESAEAASKNIKGRFDCFEGVGCSTNVKNYLLPGFMQDHAIKDLRFRLDGYKYVNLLCFFRCTEENYKILFNPESEVYTFGDTALVIHDETEFIQRVMRMVRKVGGDIVAGIVNYHKTIDSRTGTEELKNHLSIMCDQYDITLDEVVANSESTKLYGCFDKEIEFSQQYEFRICMLSKVLNTDSKILKVGNLRKLVHAVPAKNLKKYIRGYYFGRRIHSLQAPDYPMGTCSYDEIVKKVVNADSHCTILSTLG